MKKKHKAAAKRTALWVVAVSGFGVGVDFLKQDPSVWMALYVSPALVFPFVVGYLEHKQPKLYSFLNEVLRHILGIRRTSTSGSGTSSDDEDS